MMMSDLKSGGSALTRIYSLSAHLPKLDEEIESEYYIEDNHRIDTVKDIEIALLNIYVK